MERAIEQPNIQNQITRIKKSSVIAQMYNMKTNFLKQHAPT